MEKTKCKLCGERHWSREPCKGMSAAVGGKARVSETGAPDLDRQSVETPAGPGEKPGKPMAARKDGTLRKPRGSFDRNAYQRELMRKRRAEDRRIKALPEDRPPKESE